MRPYTSRAPGYPTRESVSNGRPTPVMRRAIKKSARRAGKLSVIEELTAFDKTRAEEKLEAERRAADAAELESECLLEEKDWDCFDDYLDNPYDYDDYDFYAYRDHEDEWRENAREIEHEAREEEHRLSDDYDYDWFEDPDFKENETRVDSNKVPFDIAQWKRRKQ